MTAVEQQPQPPCYAFHLVARHVPETYFWARPPVTGTRLTAISRKDCQSSVWFLPAWLAEEIFLTLAPLSHVDVLLAAYDGDSEPLEAG